MSPQSEYSDLQSPISNSESGCISPMETGIDRLYSTDQSFQSLSVNPNAQRHGYWAHATAHAFMLG